jgi:hypothetical protein
VLSEVLKPGQQGVLFHEPGALSNLLIALATADLNAVPLFAASRAWLAAHPAERWESEWAAKARPALGA